MDNLKAMAMISKDPFSIKDIKNPIESLQFWAVKRNIRAIQHIENPTLKVQRYAVTKSEEIISYIKNPVEEIQILAISNYPFGFKHIKNPTKKVVLELIFCFSLFSFDEESYQELFESEEPLLDALLNSKKEKMLFVIPAYKEELKNMNYFKSFIFYLERFHKDWITNVVPALSPLTKEQTEFWNRIRLKTLY